MVARIRLYRAYVLRRTLDQRLVQSNTRLEMPYCPFMGTRNMNCHQPGGLAGDTRPASSSPTIQ